MSSWPIFDKKTFYKNAEIYKVMSHPVRLEILNRLKNRKHTVEELITHLGLRKANVSQHLAILRYFRLVTSKRDGQRVFYRLSQPRIVEACQILKEISEEVTVA